MSAAFVYLPRWGVLLCTTCGYCLQPRPEAWVPHLRQQPHCLRGGQLKSLGELFGSYALTAPEDVEVPGSWGGDAAGPVPTPAPAPAIRGMRVLDGWQCLTCGGGLTRNVVTMRRHVSKDHGQKPRDHGNQPLWQACQLQTFFTEKRLIRYFVVTREGRQGQGEGEGKREDGEAGESD